MNKSTIFDEKYFYRLLSVINSNIDFIVNFIDFQYNSYMDDKTLMQNSRINIFTGAYRMLIATLVSLIWTIKHSCRVQGYIFL